MEINELNNKNSELSNKKLSTKIHGLDNLFHGGLHLETIGGKKPNLMIVIRGEHGTNKIHLAMQMCEGLKDSIIKDEKESLDKKNTSNSKQETVNFSEKSFKDEKPRDNNNEVISVYEYTKTKIHDRVKEKTENHSSIINSTQKRQDIWEKLQDDRIVSAIAQRALSECPEIDSIFYKFIRKKCNIGSVDIKIREVIDGIIEDMDLSEIKRILKEIDNNSEPNKHNSENNNMLFVSLNKDEDKVRELFYDFYVKRLIRNIQSKAEGWDDIVDGDIGRIKGIFTGFKHNAALGRLKSTIKYLSDDKFTINNTTKENLQKAFAEGVLYYNTRTHGVHIRKQKKNDDDNDTLLLKIKRQDEKLPKIGFWGRDKLNEGNNKADGRTLFYNLVKMVEKQKDDQYKCIMIDGLSLLTPEESEECPINALIDLMRKKCTIGILNTNDNVSLSKLDSDIIIDLRIRLDEITHHTKKELCIYKCLYQKNTYGWHQYKMRNAGVEIIPSLHKTLSRRNYIDESITEAMLPLNQVSYSYWFTENEISKVDETGGANIVSQLIRSYDKDFCAKKDKKQDLYKKISQGKLFYIPSEGYEGKDAIEKAVKAINIKDNSDHHILFIDLKRSRKDFWEWVKDSRGIVPENNDENRMFYKRMHFFGFRAGCIYADEFLHILEQQVAAIAREIRSKMKEKKPIFHYYKYVHVIMGDLNIIQYSYPCLYDEKLFLPTFSALTKGNYMTNYIYLTKEESEENTKLERQLKAIADKALECTE